MFISRAVSGAGCIAIVLAASLAAPASAEVAEVTIVHFNDLDRMEEKDGRGGVARLAAVVEAERAMGGQVLVMFGGDTISPSLLSGMDEGAHMIDLLNQIGLTAMAIGNHEFDFGPDIAEQRIAEAQFPVLGANHANPSGDQLEGAQKSIMLEAGPYSIGVFGLTTVSTVEKSSPGEYMFRPATEVAAEQAELLRSAGADLVIALAHTDLAEDEELRRQGAVDLLLSGDDHIQEVSYTGKLLYAESGEQADWVTVIDIRMEEVVDGDDKEFVWSPEYRVVDTMLVDPHPDLAAAVSEYEARLGDELDVELGTVATALDSRRETIRAKEAAIGNLIADAVRDATGADIGFMNGGGIRANREYTPGTVISRRHVMEELPFGNKTVVLEVTGQDVVDALENGLSQVENGAGRFLHVSGIEVAYDLSQPPGGRVVDVTRDGAPIDPDASYSLAVNDYVAGGGDGFALFRDKPRIVDENAAVLMTVQMFDYISSRGTVSPMVEGRLSPAQ